MPRGLRQVALSISFLSPIVRRPAAFAVTKIASLIFRPERRFLTFTSFQSLRRPSLSFGRSPCAGNLYRFLARAFALRETSKARRAFVLRAAPVRVSQPPVSRISPFSISPHMHIQRAENCSQLKADKSQSNPADGSGQWYAGP